jgi:DNA-binding IclR family transcriptional regulator
MSAQGARGTNHAERVFLVTQAFIDHGGGPLGPGEISAGTGLSDSAVHRILQSGVYSEIFVRIGRGKYRLGSKAAELGFHALEDDHDLGGTEAKEVLQRLRLKTDGGLVFLYMKAPFGYGRQCYDMAVGDSDLVELGMTPREVLSVTRSLRTGASGRTILAYMSERVQRMVLDEPVPEEAGPGVYTDNDELLASLKEVRDQGYALGYQECMKGWNSCAAPILWQGAIQGAVLLLKPAYVMPQAPQAVIDATVEAAAQLSSLNGGWPED